MSEEKVIAEKIYETHFEDYKDKYPDWFRMKRTSDGILELNFHRDGEAFRWSIDAHSALVDILHDINNDWSNEVLIVTGTGDDFLGQIDASNWAWHGYNTPYDWYKGYQVMYKRQYQEVRAWMDLDIPTIGAINGSVILHPELSLIHDIVLITPKTTISQMHAAGLHIVPGDGCNTFWNELLGPNRANYYQLTGAVIDAQKMLDWGIAGEIVPEDKLIDRAYELAEQCFMQANPWQRRLTHSVLNQHWRLAFERDLRFDLAHETLGCMVKGTIGTSEVEGELSAEDWIKQTNADSAKMRGEK